jgi:hypothetical protein
VEHSRAIVVGLGWVLGGCVADDAADAGRGEDTGAVIERVASSTSTTPRGDGASASCNGTPLPPCDGPFTGAACDLPCDGDDNADTDVPLGCGIDRTCHSDGSTYGLSTRNALLYAASPDEPDSAVEARFEAWIIEHPADLGLSAGLSTNDLELHRLADFRSSAGPLTLYRFAQTYHGVPVLAPDGIVTLVHGPRGAVSETGAIIDGRTPYEHRDARADVDKAVRSMLVHARAQGGGATGLEIVHATSVAIPVRHAIGWAGFVRSKGGAMVARVIVDADPTFAGAVLPLWSYRELAVADLANTQGIEVRGLDTTGDPSSLVYVDLTTLTTGAPLLGSVDDATLDIQLATERVVLLDLHGEVEDGLESSATRVLDPSGSFLAHTGPGLNAQTVYHLFQSWYDFIDEHLTDPVTGAKRWDSANLLYSNGGYPSDTPPGTYMPRVLAFLNATSADCPASAIACANHSGYLAGDEPVLTFPELAHTPQGASRQETTGTILLPDDGIDPVTFAHEFGHIIDLFTGGGITWDFVRDCNGECAYGCIEDTTDEGPPLTESIAQLLTFVFLLHTFDGLGWQHCSIVDMISRNGTNSWTPGPCVPDGEDISRFQRAESCASEEGDYCDKPQHPGVDQRCCFDDEDLTDCTLLLPAQCPVGDTGPNGGMGTGTARPVPTGLCEARQGYATNSLFQAFWQLLNGQRCDPTPPFACVSTSWAPGIDPMDATTEAFLYALRINPLTYDQLFGAMATYVSCTYGPAAYEEFNAVACNHGIRDCTAPAPMKCQDCGNGVREGTEGCDGSDWLLTSCDDLPTYSGGMLTCNQTTCTLDVTQCSMPGLDTTAGTVTPDASTTAPDTDTDADSSAAGSDTGSDGCRCRARSPTSAWIVLFPVTLLGARRRRGAA